MFFQTLLYLKTKYILFLLVLEFLYNLPSRESAGGKCLLAGDCRPSAGSQGGVRQKPDGVVVVIGERVLLTLYELIPNSSTVHHYYNAVYIHLNTAAFFSCSKQTGNWIHRKHFLPDQMTLHIPQVFSFTSCLQTLQVCTTTGCLQTLQLCTTTGCLQTLQM